MFQQPQVGGGHTGPRLLAVPGTNSLIHPSYKRSFEWPFVAILPSGE